MGIYKSRHTPDLKNGKDVHFAFGERCVYERRNGKIINIIIASEIMSHDECPSGGYESLFLDSNELYFASAAQILKWTDDDDKRRSEIAEGIELVKQYAPQQIKQWLEEEEPKPEIPEQMIEAIQEIEGYSIIRGFAPFPNIKNIRYKTIQYDEYIIHKAKFDALKEYQRLTEALEIIPDFRCISYWQKTDDKYRNHIIERLGEKPPEGSFLSLKNVIYDIFFSLMCKGEVRGDLLKAVDDLKKGIQNDALKQIMKEKFVY
jgi:hypothetical protein